MQSLTRYRIDNEQSTGTTRGPRSVSLAIEAFTGIDVGSSPAIDPPCFAFGAVKTSNDELASTENFRCNPPRLGAAIRGDAGKFAHSSVPLALSQSPASARLSTYPREDKRALATT